MQLKAKYWLAGLAALAAATTAMPPAFAVESTETGPPVRIQNFSGAYLAGRIAESDDDLPGAIRYYKQALVFDPNNQSLQQSLLLALISNGQFDESLPYADKLKSVPEVERISRVALGVEAIRQKQYKQSQEWLELALVSDLDRLIVNIMGAWAIVGEGNAQAALDKLDELQGPEWYALFRSYHQALIADAAGIKNRAEEGYKQAVDNVGGGATAPDTYLRAAESYANYLYREGRREEALLILDKAESLVSNRLPIIELRKKVSDGAKVDRMISNPQQGASEALLNLGTALNRGGGGGEPFVRLYLRLALALEPQNDLALMHLAEVTEEQENPQGAIDLYRRVPAHSVFKRLSELQWGLNLADLDKKDEAITQLKRLLDRSPDDMRSYLALGGVYSSKDDFRSAATLYDQAVERLKTPTKADWNIFYQRGIAYERLKEWPKAEPNFKRALELFPNQPQVMNYLGYSWVDMDINLNEGLDLIRKAVDLRPSDGYIVDSLGWAYYKLGRFEEAATELERAVSLKPDDPVLNDHLGDAYWRAGRRLEATFQWNHARDLKPEPEVLASVQKKLREGLPPLEPKAAGPAPEPSAPEPEPEPIKKTELTPPVAPVVSPPVAPPIDPVAAPAPQPTTPPAPPATDDPAMPAAPQETTATPASYVVQRGQSLWSIAVERLGKGERYIEIIDLNPKLRDQGVLLPGTEILLPGS